MNQPAETIRPRVYIAGPLFSDAEIDFNRRVRELLAAHYETYLPQEDGGLMVEMVADGLSPEVGAQRVFERDIQALDWCDIILVILDGRAVDEGAAFELGYAYANRKLCYGLKTDPRQLLKIGDNPMIECALRGIFRSLQELASWAASYYLENARTALEHDGLWTTGLRGHDEAPG